MIELHALYYMLADVMDSSNQSPLELALKSNHIIAAHYLICHCGGASEKIVAKLLCGACEEGEFDVVKELIERYKADPNCEYKLSFTV